MGGERGEKEYLNLDNDEDKKKLRKKLKYAKTSEKDLKGEPLVDSGVNKIKKPEKLPPLEKPEEAPPVKKIDEEKVKPSMEDIESAKKWLKEELATGEKVSMFDSDEEDVEKEVIEESDVTDKKAKGKTVKPPVKKPGEVKEKVETEIDKLYELVRDKGILKISDASKIFGIEIDQIEEWGRVLDQHKLIKLHYPPVGEPVLILKKFKSETKEIKKLKEKERLKPGRKVFIINLVILFGFMGFFAFQIIMPLRTIDNFISQIVSFFSGIFGGLGIPTVRVSYQQAYLIAMVIIIIGIVVILKLIKRRGG